MDIVQSCTNLNRLQELWINAFVDASLETVALDEGTRDKLNDEDNVDHAQPEMKSVWNNESVKL